MPAESSLSARKRAQLHCTIGEEEQNSENAHQLDVRHLQQRQMHKGSAQTIVAYSTRLREKDEERDSERAEAEEAEFPVEGDQVADRLVGVRARDGAACANLQSPRGAGSSVIMLVG